MFPDSNLAGYFETVQKTFCRLAAASGDQFSTFVESYACASGYDYYRRKQMKFRHSPALVLLPGKSHGQRSLVGCSPWGRSESDMTDFTFTFHFHALEKEMATHSGVLAWIIPGMGEPGGLPSMGSHRVGHD